MVPFGQDPKQSGVSLRQRLQLLRRRAFDCATSQLGERESVCQELKERIFFVGEIQEQKVLSVRCG